MPEKNINQKIQIFEYSDYRQYLKDWYLHAKQSRVGFSFRAFAKTAGYTSPNFLKLVMEGKRNLSAQSILVFAQVLKLSRDESRFFRSLVSLNQATTAEEKEIHRRQVFRSKKFKNLQPLQEAQFHYYSHWYFIPIREMVGARGFQKNPHLIAKKLIPSISPQQAQQAIQELLALNLIREDARGRLTQTHSVINTADEVTSTSIPIFHQEMLKRASEAIDIFPKEKREISSATVGVSDVNAQRIKKMLQRFRQKILAIAAEEQNIEGIHQINFQFFPLSTKLEGEE
jgi:uncharacterized protein (TIGR02147 family)